MSWNSEPTAEGVARFARRMEAFWANQNTQYDIFLALEQMRNKPSVATMEGSTTPVTHLRAGTYGVLVDEEGALAVRSVLNAAGWTYVAATLQSILTLAYYLFRFSGVLNSRDD